MKKIQDVFDQLQLGRIIGEPERVYGGLLHRMMKIETEQGRYAVKVLNPTIMKRPRVLEKLEMSELVALKAVKAGIPAVCAIGKTENVHCAGSEYVMIFPWVEALTMPADQVTTEHCKKVGAILATIHAQENKEAKALYRREESLEPINWSSFLKVEGKCAGKLLEQISKLDEWDLRASSAAEVVLKQQRISHRDLDCKNILWDETGDPFVIDWEASGWVNPAAELLETACSWSGVEINAFDAQKFDALATSYEKAGGSLEVDWEAILDFGFRNKLEWLAYNYKRCFGIEPCDEEERALAEREVGLTYEALKAYEALLPILHAKLNRKQTEG